MEMSLSLPCEFSLSCTGEEEVRNAEAERPAIPLEASLFIMPDSTFFDFEGEHTSTAAGAFVTIEVLMGDPPASRPEQAFLTLS